MLFVRRRGGISHNPMEYTSPRDLGLAVATLIGFIESFQSEMLG
jgi:allantoate deiminase